MRRVCVITTSFPRNEGDDSGIFVRRMVAAMSDCGAMGVVIVQRDGDEPAYEELGSFSVHRAEYGVFDRGALTRGSGIMPNLRAKPWLWFQVPLLIGTLTKKAFTLRERFDEIHAHWSGALFGAFILHVVSRVQFTAVVRGEDMRLMRSRLLRPIFRLMLRRAKRVVTVSDEFAQQMRALFPDVAAKVECIPNGIEILPVEAERLEACARSRGLDPNGRYLLFIGSVIPRKRIELLIDALGQPQLADFSLIVAGRAADSRYLDLLRERAQQLNVTDRVRFIGQIAPADIGCLLACARCYVSASTFEGRPNALLEAMAFGRICFASDIPAHRECLGNNQRGFIFIDATDLAATINRVTRDGELENRVAAAARAFVQPLSWRACAERYLALLR